MISDATKQKLDALAAEQRSYLPNSSTREQLAQKSMLMIVGATCEGKNTVMETIVRLDSRFQVTGRFTTRDPRPSDDPSRYTYIPNTDEALANLLSRITAREVVQYAVNPYAHLIYGSTIDDYAAEHNLGDVFASAVADFERLGFAQAIAITIVSEPHEWLQRFNERFPLGHEQRKARRDEAIESFTWSLSNTSSNHFIVENMQDNPETAARNIIRLADGAVLEDADARKLLEQSLEIARTIEA